MLIGELLDDAARSVARVICGVAAAVVLLLVLAVFVPVVVIIGIVHSVVPIGGPPLPLPPIPAKPPITLPTPPVNLPPTLGRRVVDEARNYLGVPYLFGGINPALGLDCSGLVQLVYRQLGIALPRTAQLQYDATARIEPDQLQPGDVVFFAHTYADPHDWITHVGIYIGGGLQINAPTDGQVVSIQPVFSGFWGAHFASGGRVLSE